MAEGDTLARIAEVLRPALADQQVIGARGRPGGATLDRLVGTRASSVEARGKHLLIGFDNGLTLHTHLGLHGSWHRYRRGERWRRPTDRAAAVIETSDWTCACFDAPTVELLDSRAVALHPQLRRLGPDASAADFDLEAAPRRLRSPKHAERPIGDALLDQRIVAGLGNVYRSEVCFIERVDPFASVGSLDDEVLRRLLATGARLLRANATGGQRVTTAPPTMARRGDGALYVYGRTGRPCRRCGSPIASGLSRDGRRAYWCPRCQS